MMLAEGIEMATGAHEIMAKTISFFMDMEGVHPGREIFHSQVDLHPFGSLGQLCFSDLLPLGVHQGGLGLGAGDSPQAQTNKAAKANAVARTLLFI